MELSDIRKEIDAIDEEMAKLFVRRMKAVDAVAAAKRASGAPVLDAAREREVLERAAAHAGPGLTDEARRFFSDLMAISRARQQSVFGIMTGNDDSVHR